MINPDSPEIQAILDADQALAWKIDQLLGLSLSKKQIMELGFKEATVRAAINKRKEEGKPVTASGPREPSLIPAITRGTEAILPEYVSGEISEYFDGSLEQQRIFKAGMLVPLMGIRLFTEMVKPIVMMMNAMKSDQVEAMGKAMLLGQQQANEAAIQASEMTANRIIESQKSLAISGSADPMKAMFAQSLMPVMTTLMGRLTGGLLGGGQRQPAVSQDDKAAPGFTHRSVGSIEELDKDKEEKDNVR